MSATRQAIIVFGLVIVGLLSGCRSKDKSKAKPAATTTAQQGKGAPPSSESDLSGKWSFKIENPSVKGPCPAGKNEQGSVEIEKAREGYALVYLMGRTCQPKSMCDFKGKLEGKVLSLSNRDTVDSEGGVVSNTLELTLSSSKSMKGVGQSHYQHPQGMRCDWRYDVTLTRAE
jgi:hypothetical protein